MRSWPKGKVGRSGRVSLSDGSTGGEELQLKGRTQILKNEERSGSQDRKSAYAAAFQEKLSCTKGTNVLVI
ncbi:hypothetical protein ABU952_18930 [Bacillus amyloliquefaciens]|uniref:hypothetical protein n=1 Tax=Bacillus amyloliquefaciens TaxID=1390 RepID=UPI00336B8ACA